MFCKTCLSHHCASITPSSSSTESTAIQRRRKKNKEGKKPTQLSLKIDFSLKKKILCYGGRTFGSISPLWQSVTINIHQGFHRHAKKNCPSQNGRRWHWCFLQSDRLASASTCSSKTEILCQHYAKDRWTNEAMILYSVTDQQKTNEFDSQMKKNQVKNITPKIVGQMEQHNVHNVQCYRSTQSYISPLSKMKKSRLKERQFQLTNFTQR